MANSYPVAVGTINSVVVGVSAPAARSFFEMEKIIESLKYGIVRVRNAVLVGADVEAVVVGPDLRIVQHTGAPIIRIIGGIHDVNVISAGRIGSLAYREIKVRGTQVVSRGVFVLSML